MERSNIRKALIETFINSIQSKNSGDAISILAMIGIETVMKELNKQQRQTKTFENVENTKLLNDVALIKKQLEILNQHCNQIQKEGPRSIQKSRSPPQELQQTAPRGRVDYYQAIRSKNRRVTPKITESVIPSYLDQERTVQDRKKVRHHLDDRQMKEALSQSNWDVGSPQESKRPQKSCSYFIDFKEQPSVPQETRIKSRTNLSSYQSDPIPFQAEDYVRLQQEALESYRQQLMQQNEENLQQSEKDFEEEFNEHNSYQNTNPVSVRQLSQGVQQSFQGTHFQINRGDTGNFMVPRERCSPEFNDQKLMQRVGGESTQRRSGEFVRRSQQLEQQNIQPYNPSFGETRNNKSNNSEQNNEYQNSQMSEPRQDDPSPPYQQQNLLTVANSLLNSPIIRQISCAKSGSSSSFDNCEREVALYLRNNQNNNLDKIQITGFEPLSPKRYYYDKGDLEGEEGGNQSPSNSSAFSLFKPNEELRSFFHKEFIQNIKIQNSDKEPLKEQVNKAYNMMQYERLEKNKESVYQSKVENNMNHGVLPKVSNVFVKGRMGNSKII